MNGINIDMLKKLHETKEAAGGIHWERWIIRKLTFRMVVDL